MIRITGALLSFLFFSPPPSPSLLSGVEVVSFPSGGLTLPGVLWQAIRSGASRQYSAQSERRIALQSMRQALLKVGRKRPGSSLDDARGPQFASSHFFLPGRERLRSLAEPLALSGHEGRWQ